MFRKTNREGPASLTNIDEVQDWQVMAYTRLSLWVIVLLIDMWPLGPLMEVSAHKAEALLFPFSSSLKPSTVSLPGSITLGSHNIPFSDYARNLGFILDSKLSMKHVTLRIYIFGSSLVCCFERCWCMLNPLENWCNNTTPPPSSLIIMYKAILNMQVIFYLQCCWEKCFPVTRERKYTDCWKKNNLCG